MHSPFPGVDPYLEAQPLWRDFHATFILCWRELLLQQLPQRYDARTDEDVYVGRLAEAEVRKLMRPDVAVELLRQPRRQAGRGGVAVEEEVDLQPVRIPHTVIEERRINYITIKDKPHDRLVAVLELLSPTNKSWGRRKYLKKRLELRKARVHLVEVDLLIGGRSPPLAMAPPQAHYHILLTRGNRRKTCEVYSWDLQDPLPTIPIPLLKPDPDLRSNLATVFNLAYERGQYWRAIDYSRPLDLPLNEPTLKWASDLGRQFAAGKLTHR